MKLLVTGAGGFLGRHVVCALVDRGHAVRALVRPGRPAPAWPAAVEVARGDLRAADPAALLAGTDGVVHLAATLRGSWKTMFDCNVVATERLLAAMAAGGPRRLVHVSSFGVYGASQLPAGAVLDETAPLEPRPADRDPYSWTKFEQERVVREGARKAGLALTVIRPGAIFGRESPFTARLGLWPARRLFVVFGGDVPVPLAYVENVAALIALAAERPEAVGETFNAVEERPPTQLEYLAHLHRALAPQAPIVRVPMPLLETVGGVLEAVARLSGGRIARPGILVPYKFRPLYRRFRYPMTHACARLGWQAPVPFAEALRRTFAAPR